MQLPNSTNRGFTLIELLVVISIIGLLSSVVLASVNTARTKAIWTVSNQNMLNLVGAMQRYVLDTGYLPDPGDGSIHCLGKYGGAECEPGITVSPTLNSILKNYVADLPAFPKPPFPGIQPLYPWYQCIARDGGAIGKCTQVTIFYYALHTLGCLQNSYALSPGDPYDLCEIDAFSSQFY